MLHREADAGVRELAGGRILAPNDYVITLSVPDYQKVSADPDLTTNTFARHLEGYIHEQGWQTYGDVVVRFEQSATLHTGQFRARGAVNPDSTTGEPAPALRDSAFTAEPGVGPMTDNPSYRGGQQGRPDEYPDDRYGRPEDREGGQDPRAPRTRPTSAATRRQPSPATASARAIPTRAATRRSRAATPTRAATRRSRAATHRPATSSVRPPAIRRSRAATPTRADIARRPAATRRPPASRVTAAVTTVVRLRHRGRRTTAVESPGPPTPTRVATRRSRAATPSRATEASHMAARTKVTEPSPTTAATASPRRQAVTPTRATRSPRAAHTTTVLPQVRPQADTPATDRATIRPAVPPSRFSSTTAAAGPTSCVKAPT